MLNFFRKQNKVTVILKGGLGNQLFQIASTLHYAKKFNFTPLFSSETKIKSSADDTVRGTYWKIFNTQNKLCLAKIDKKDYQRYSEKSFSYKPFKRKYKDIRLNGYYQSPKYVDLVRDEMISFLWSNKNVNILVNKIYKEIVDFYNTEELVSIHIRRGDYNKILDIHPRQPISYYVEAIRQFPENMPVVVFSNDQKWCKEELSKEINNSLYFIEDEDYVEVLLMSKIKNNIIANSSFSWWSTYINQNLKSKTIAPKEWFGKDWQGPDGKNDWSDIYCESWVLL